MYFTSICTKGKGGLCKKWLLTENHHQNQNQLEADAWNLEDDEDNEIFS